ncbi:MAG: methylenetetrahydromethanopterin dehydrogenase, partial [Burkholderiales bacterium]
PVGATAAVLMSKAGARVSIVSHASVARAQQVAQAYSARYGGEMQAVAGDPPENKRIILREVDLLLGCAKAGTQVVDAALLAEAKHLLVAADVNAVPPAGIEGIGVMDDGVKMNTGRGAVGIGALAIGNLKYQAQKALFQAMIRAEKPLYIDFRDAFEFARKQVG